MRYLTFSMTLLAAAPLAAQLRPVTCCNKGPEIAYDISFPNAAHHEAEVKATFTVLAAGPVNFRFARSSTGRYALTEYAKNIYAVRAVDGTGKTLRVTHPDPYSWTVTGHNGTVTLSYTSFGNVGSGTYSGFNVEQEHIHPQSVFAYVKGLEVRPIRVRFHRLDPNWTIATQLVPTRDPETFTAPGLQYLFDSPTHLGNIQWREWTEEHGGVKQTWRVALDDPTAAAAIDVYADGAKKIVHEAGGVYGEFPRFDYGTYTFVACYRSDCQGDGMEHRNSTSLTGDQHGRRWQFPAEHPVARIFPRLERETDPSHRHRALGLRQGQHDRRPVDRGRIHPILWPAAHGESGSHARRGSGTQPWFHDQRGRQSAGAPLLRPHRDEQSGPLPRRRGSRRSGGPQPVHLLLHLRRRDRDCARFLAPGARKVARRFHAGNVATLRQTGSTL